MPRGGVARLEFAIVLELLAERFAALDSAPAQEYLYVANIVARGTDVVAVILP